MEKFLLKRRKINDCDSLVTFACDICYNDVSTSKLVLCFYDCTIKTCTDCVVKQIKIEKTRRLHSTTNKEIYAVSYTCSMCQQKSYYKKKEGSNDPWPNQFTKWVQTNPNILVKILDKFINPVIPEPPRNNNNNNDEDEIGTFQNDNDILGDFPSTFYTDEINTPSPSLLPFPYRLLLAPTLSIPPLLMASGRILSTQYTTQDYEDTVSHIDNFSSSEHVPTLIRSETIHPTVSARSDSVHTNRTMGGSPTESEETE